MLTKLKTDIDEGKFIDINKYQELKDPNLIMKLFMYNSNFHNRDYNIELQREKELRDTQGRIIDNTKKLNQAVAKRKSIEAEIIDVKLNAFDEIIDEKTAAQTLTLK